MDTRYDDINLTVEYLREIWLHFPEWRFGQLLENVLGCNKYDCIFHYEDRKTFAKIQEKYNEWLNDKTGSSRN